MVRKHAAMRWGRKPSRGSSRQPLPASPRPPRPRGWDLLHLTLLIAVAVFFSQHGCRVRFVATVDHDHALHPGCAQHAVQHSATPPILPVHETPRSQSPSQSKSTP